MNRLWVRLTVGFLGIVLLLLLMVTLAVNYSVTTSFRQFVTETDMANLGPVAVDDLVKRTFARRAAGTESIRCCRRAGTGRAGAAGAASSHSWLTPKG